MKQTERGCREALGSRGSREGCPHPVLSCRAAGPQAGTRHVLLLSPLSACLRCTRWGHGGVGCGRRLRGRGSRSGPGDAGWRAEEAGVLAKREVAELSVRWCRKKLRDQRPRTSGPDTRAEVLSRVPRDDGPAVVRSTHPPPGEVQLTTQALRESGHAQGRGTENGADPPVPSTFLRGHVVS